eukprot:symbB.v1.2.015905.t1/scaffold1195.1/size134849/16
MQSKSQSAFTDLRNWTRLLGQKDQKAHGIHQLLRDVEAFNLQVNIIVANAALGALARQTAWKETLFQLDEICSRNLELTQISFGSCLDALDESCGLRWRKAIQFLVDMEKFSNISSIVCWNSCISSMHSWIQADLLLLRIRSLGLQPDCISHNAAAANAPWSRAVLELIQMRQTRLGPNVVTYNIILHAYQGSHAEAARTLIVSMLTERLQPDVITMNSAIGASHDDWSAVLQYLRELHGRTALSAGNALKALSSSVQWQQGLQVVEFLQPYRVINAVAATTAFNLASYAKEVDLVYGLLEDFQASNLRLSLRCSNAVLHTLKIWSNALRQLEGQASNSLVPNEVSYNTVCGHMTDDSCWSQVIGLLSRQRYCSLRIDVMGCGSSITACASCLVPLWKEALMLMNFMRCFLISAEATNHNSLIFALRTDGQWQRAILPASADAVTIGSVLSAHLEEEAWQQAIGTLHWVANGGRQMDAAAIEAAALTCGRAGLWRRALTVRMQMLPWKGAMSDASMETTMVSMQACLSQDAWRRALAFSSLFAVPDVPLMTLKLKVLEVGKKHFLASSTLEQLYHAGLAHVQGLRRFRTVCRRVLDSRPFVSAAQNRARQLNVRGKTLCSDPKISGSLPSALEQVAVLALRNIDQSVFRMSDQVAEPASTRKGSRGKGKGKRRRADSRGPDSSNWRAVPRETEPEALRSAVVASAEPQEEGKGKGDRRRQQGGKGGPDSSNWRAVPRETEPEALRCAVVASAEPQEEGKGKGDRRRQQGGKGKGKGKSKNKEKNGDQDRKDQSETKGHKDLKAPELSRLQTPEYGSVTERLADQLSRGTYDCMICLNKAR